MPTNTGKDSAQLDDLYQAAAGSIGDAFPAVLAVQADAGSDGEITLGVLRSGLGSAASSRAARYSATFVGRPEAVVPVYRFSIDGCRLMLLTEP